MKKGVEVREKRGRYFKEEELIKLIEEELPSLVSKRPELKLKLRALFDDVAMKSDIVAVLQEIKNLREDMEKLREDTNRRFEAVDRRFEALREDMDRRFEAMREDMERRFEAMREDMNRRFEALREDMDRRFEALREDMDRRFEAFSKDMDKRFEAMRIDFKEAIEKIARALSSKIDTVGSRWGIMAENSVRELLNDVVSRVGFTTIKWKKMDEEKRFFPYPRYAEIDVLMKNDRVIAVEVKSSLTMGEVEDFDRCVRFYEETEGRRVNEKIILAIHPYPGVREYASNFGIRIISAPEEIEGQKSD